MIETEYKYISNISAAELERSILIYCDSCKVCFTGCWDNFLCPKCNQGHLPKYQEQLEDNVSFEG